MTERNNSRRNSLLQENFFNAAFEILASEGYGGLRLKPLCRYMGVTTGSFYHSFDGWQDFTDALLAAWLRERTEATVDLVRQTEDPVARLRDLARAAADLPHRTEAAIRVWASVDEGVAAVQRRVDEGRYGVVHEAMVAIVGAENAGRYANWGLSTLIGFELTTKDHDRDDVLWSIEQVLAAAELEGGA